MRLIHDLDKDLGQKMYAINGLGGARGFALAWPAVWNYRVGAAAPPTLGVRRTSTGE